MTLFGVGSTHSQDVVRIDAEFDINFVASFSSVQWDITESYVVLCHLLISFQNNQGLVICGDRDCLRLFERDRAILHDVGIHGLAEPRLGEHARQEALLNLSGLEQADWERCNVVECDLINALISACLARKLPRIDSRAVSYDRICVNVAINGHLVAEKFAYLLSHNRRLG